MKKLIIALFLLTCQWNLFSQTNNILEPFETDGAFGVRLLSSDNSSTTIVSPTFDYIEIMDSTELIEARRYSLVPGDSTKRLPAPVIEYYTLDGNLKYRNINLLLEADTDGSYCKEYQKRYFSVEMDIALLMKDALKEKEMGRRREAYQKFMAIYQKYPNFELAKTSADNIKASIRTQRLQTIDQMNREAAEREAAYQQLSASLQQLSATIGQLANSGQHQVASRQVSTINHQQSEPAIHETSSSSRNDNKTKYRRYGSASSNKTTQATKTTKSSRSSSQRGHMWCYDKKLERCTLCLGSGTCNFCRGGRINGFVCKTCCGTNICKRCNGAKQIYR